MCDPNGLIIYDINLEDWWPLRDETYQPQINPHLYFLLMIIYLFHFYIFRSGSVRSENLENSLKSMAVGSYMTLDRRNSKGRNKRFFNVIIF